VRRESRSRTESRPRHLRAPSEVRPIAVRRFFGCAALVIDGLQIGFVMKRSLYLRVDDLSLLSSRP
jgi:hypothetical protein